jgi:hypothetical protein
VLLIVLEFEFLGLIFGIIYVGGIAVMFLFLILTVDVRVENNTKVFVINVYSLCQKISLSVVFSTFFSFLFLKFCNPSLFYNIDFFLHCNRKILGGIEFPDLIYMVDSLPSFYENIHYTDKLIYSASDPESSMHFAWSLYKIFDAEFFLDFFLYFEGVDDVNALGIFFLSYHYPLLVLIGLFLLVVTIVAVILCLNIFG